MLAAKAQMLSPSPQRQAAASGGGDRTRSSSPAGPVPAYPQPKRMPASKVDPATGAELFKMSDTASSNDSERVRESWAECADSSRDAPDDYGAMDDLRDRTDAARLADRLASKRSALSSAASAASSNAWTSREGRRGKGLPTLATRPWRPGLPQTLAGQALSSRGHLSLEHVGTVGIGPRLATSWTERHSSDCLRRFSADVCFLFAWTVGLAPRQLSLFSPGTLGTAGCLPRIQKLSSTAHLRHTHRLDETSHTQWHIHMRAHIYASAS